VLSLNDTPLGNLKQIVNGTRVNTKFINTRKGELFDNLESKTQD